MVEDLKSFFIKKSNYNYSVQMRYLGKKSRSCSIWIGWLFCSVPRCCSISPWAPKLGIPSSAARQAAALQCTKAAGLGWKCTSLGSNLPNSLKTRAWSQSCGSGLPLSVDTSWLESKPRRDRLSWGRALKSGKLTKAEVQPSLYEKLLGKICF